MQQCGRNATELQRLTLSYPLTVVNYQALRYSKVRPGWPGLSLWQQEPPNNRPPSGQPAGRPVDNSGCFYMIRTEVAAGVE